MRRTSAMLWGMAALLVVGCGAATQTGVNKPAPDGTAAAPAPGGGGGAGPAIEVSYSVMAEVLHLTEEVSLWREGMPRLVFKAFEAKFGLDATDYELLKKFAFARSELQDKFRKGAPPPTFDAPFGPEGLFPASGSSLVDRFWGAVMAATEPKAVGRALAGIVEPSDAEAIAAALGRLAPRAGQIIAGFGGYGKQAEQIGGLLHLPQVGPLLAAMGRLAGVETQGLSFKVHPVWVPSDAPFEAIAYGDRILVTLPEGASVGPQQAALVVHEIGRRLLAQMSAETKALCTLRFAEKAGYRGEPFPLVEGLLDALSHGLAAPLMASGPAEVPPWPGDDARKRLAEALTPLLRGALAKGERLDGVLALKAGEVESKCNPPRPGDFVNAAMIIAEDDAMAPFKSQVVRWTVWKFPPSKKFDYPRKLDTTPGRSVLMILTPVELKELPARFQGVRGVPEAFQQAFKVMAKKPGVIIAIKRESRGFIFLLSAHSPEVMKLVAKAFFALDHVPDEPVEVE